MRTTGSKSSSRVSIRRPHAVRKSKLQNALGAIAFFGAIAIVGGFVLANSGDSGDAPETVASSDASVENDGLASMGAANGPIVTEVPAPPSDFYDDYYDDYVPGPMPGERVYNEGAPSRRLADGSPVPGDRW